MFQWLIDLDRDVFLFFNGLHSPTWDTIMWYISQVYVWIPLYILALVAIIYRDHSYRVIFTILFLAVTVLIDDQLSVLIKNLVERPRPTHNPDIADIVHTVIPPGWTSDYRGGSYGFVSSHAANAFGAAAYLIYELKDNKWKWLFAWAVVVSYSRIYLGVHYPLDIICGALLGVLVGVQCYVVKVRCVSYVEKRTTIRQVNQNAKRREKEAKRAAKEAEQVTVSAPPEVGKDKV